MLHFLCLEVESLLAFSTTTNRGEAIMLVKLSIILLAIPIILPIILTDFTYYSQNYAWFNLHSIPDS